MSFSGDINKFSDRVNQAISAIVRGTSLEIYRAIVRRTPVRTGRLRANWQVQINSPAQGEINSTNAQNTIRAGETKIKQFRVGDTVYINNNLPYAKVIEDGRIGNKGSKQAPNGMVKVTIAEYQLIVQRNALRHKLK